MEYTPVERLTRLWALTQEDPECMECLREMQQLQRRLEEYTDALTTEEGQAFWALPVTQNTYFHRVLEVVSRQMRLPEEGEGRANH